MTFIWSPKPRKVIIYDPRGQASAFKCGKGRQGWSRAGTQECFWSAGPSSSWSGCQLHKCIQQVIIHQDARFVNFSVLKFCFDKNIIKQCFWMVSMDLFVYLYRALKGLPTNSFPEWCIPVGSRKLRFYFTLLNTIQKMEALEAEVGVSSHNYPWWWLCYTL